MDIIVTPRVQVVNGVVAMRNLKREPVKRWRTYKLTPKREKCLMRTLGIGWTTKRQNRFQSWLGEDKPVVANKPTCFECLIGVGCFVIVAVGIIAIGLALMGQLY